MFSYLNTSNEVLEEFLRNILDNYLGREVTVLCLHRPSQEVCGGLFSNGINHDIPEVFTENILPFIEPVTHLLEEIEKCFFTKYPRNPRECLHQYMLGVDKKWAGNKIGENLVLASLQAGRAQGLTYGLVELTGKASQHIFVDLVKYSVAHEVTHGEYEANGRKVFEHLEGLCIIAWKEI